MRNSEKWVPHIEAANAEVFLGEFREMSAVAGALAAPKYSQRIACALKVYNICLECSAFAPMSV